MAVTVLIWKQSQAVQELVARGQGEQILQSLRATLHGRNGPPTQEIVDEFLQQNESIGLRYVGFLGPLNDRLEAGESLVPPGVPAANGESTSWSGQRLRIVRPLPRPEGRPPQARGEGGRRRQERRFDEWGAPLPPRADAEGMLEPGDNPEAPFAHPPEPDALMDGDTAGLAPGDDPPPPDRPASRADGPPDEQAGGGARPATVPASISIEIQPPLVEEIHSRTLILVVIGASSALALMLVAIFFWRQSLQAEALVATLEAQRRLAALGEMSAVLAHEIKNPLAALKGHAQLLGESLPAGTREARKAERVIREAVRLEQLVLQLLDFVRSGRVNRESVVIRELLQDAMEGMNPDRLKLDLENESLQFRMDRGRMSQVISNLLRNALQADEQGVIELSARLTPAGLVIEVRDRGVGIPKGEEETIFEPFQTRRIQGVGLGLAVARRIVQAHGGTLVASHRPGGGAIFRMTIPDVA
jgi:two-component system sensor histidine kinase HydH